MTAPAKPQAATIPLPNIPSRTIEELAREQGVPIPQNLDDLLGAGVDLWESDEEFEEFQHWLRRNQVKGN